ncbi:MAG: hypothetical protein ACLROI_12670 [Beduini sp.]|uniref:hypothetical protein n=1 Tax=Beduini sp. TaxID=1922300 RepID=UPI003990CD5E
MNKNEKQKTGRKGSYELRIKPHFSYIGKLIKKGYKEKDIAKALGVCESTWYKCKAEHSEFSEFIIKCRTEPVKEIEAAMFDSARGFTKKVKKAIKVKNVEYSDGKKASEKEEVIFYEDELYFPPNPMSAKFLLLNWAKNSKGIPKYANDPQTIKLREKELELKEKSQEDWE